MEDVVAEMDTVEASIMPPNNPISALYQERQCFETRECKFNSRTWPANPQQHRNARKVHQVRSQPMGKQQIPHHEDVVKWKFSSKQ